MDYREIFVQSFRFLVYIIIQVTILKNLVVFGSAFCFVYIGFLLFTPISYNRQILMMLGFFSGLTIDIFYDSLGIHAAAGVLIGAIRPNVISLLTPQGGYEIGALPTLNSMGFGWYLGFSLILVLIHHLTIFIIEAGGFSLLFFTLVKVFSSIVFTFLILTVAQILFGRQKST